MQFFIYDFMVTKTIFLYILIYFRYAIPQILSLTLCYRVISNGRSIEQFNKIVLQDCCKIFTSIL